MIFKASINASNLKRNPYLKATLSAKIYFYIFTCSDFHSFNIPGMRGLDYVLLGVHLVGLGHGTNNPDTSLGIRVAVERVTELWRWRQDDVILWHGGSKGMMVMTMVVMMEQVHGWWNSNA